MNGGRYAAKAIEGEFVVVGADIFREGHDKLAACVRYRGPDDDTWREAPLRPDVNDRWYGSFGVDGVGPWRYHVLGWTDHFASWLDGLRKKHAAGQEDLSLDFADGAALLARRKVPRAARVVLDGVTATLRSTASNEHKIAAVDDPDLVELLRRHPERLDASQSKPDLPLWVDRQAAQFTAWYEMFPRSEGATAISSGTFKDAAQRFPAIAAMGFDVVYLPPVHPIGRSFRKGPNNTLTPGPDDPGVPWAIGGPEGGHTAVHPDLGTLEDFDAFVEQAKDHGLEIALDFAIQCSPDHPWVTEHPEWFRHRADGSIAYAENPPKKYQDIYPVDFDTKDIDALTAELKGVVDFWIDRGIRIFRVDNPHTKPFGFWEWLIASVHLRHPDVLFLSEAFTRPKVMQTLAKLGFSQSYTYFAWRTTKSELEEYVTELAHTDIADYLRPSFWPNTPDILTEYLQTSGPAGFKVRLALAALLSPAYGIYSGYELYEHEPVREGSEEYLNSEKYQYRPRDWDRPDSLAPWIARINQIRRQHPVLQQLRTTWLHHIGNDAMMCFSKVGPDRSDPILVVVNLDPHQPQDGSTWLDMWQLGMEGVGPFEAHDLLSGTTYIWHGQSNYVRLDPAVEVAHVLRLRPL